MRHCALGRSEHCNGSSSALGLFSAPALEGPWEFTSTPLPRAQLECPDYWPVVPIGGGSNAGLSAIKLSEGGKEAVYVGTMDEDTQTMTNLVEPLVGGSPQLLDAATCAYPCRNRPCQPACGLRVLLRLRRLEVLL